MIALTLILLIGIFLFKCCFTKNSPQYQRVGKLSPNDDLLCVHSCKSGSAYISGYMVNGRIARAASCIFNYFIAKNVRGLIHEYPYTQHGDGATCCCHIPHLSVYILMKYIPYSAYISPKAVSNIFVEIILRNAQHTHARRR